MMRFWAVILLLRAERASLSLWWRSWLSSTGRIFARSTRPGVKCPVKSSSSVRGEGAVVAADGGGSWPSLFLLAKFAFDARRLLTFSLPDRVIESQDWYHIRDGFDRSRRIAPTRLPILP